MIFQVIAIPLKTQSYEQPHLECSIYSINNLFKILFEVIWVEIHSLSMCASVGNESFLFSINIILGEEFV